MASSLQKQLQQVQNNNVLKPGKIRRAPSLLYEPKVAADMDLEEIYITAVSGFHELAVREPREQSIHVDRLTLDKAENEKLNRECVHLLRLLAPFFTYKTTLKVLEWLIRRFSIQEYIADDFLLAFFPYHDHPFFARVLACSKPKSRPMLFLKPAIEMRVALSRADVVHAMIRDKDLLSMFAQFAQASAESNTMYSALARFWAGVFLEIMISWSSSNVDSNVIMDRLFLYISYAVSYPVNTDFQISGFMCLSALAVSFPLHVTIIPPLLDAITLRVTTNNILPALICIGHLLQAHQGAIDFQQEWVDRLEGYGSSKLLMELNQKYRMDKFFTIYWLNLLKSKKSNRRELLHLLDNSFSHLHISFEQAKALLSTISLQSEYSTLQSYRRVMNNANMNEESTVKDVQTTGIVKQLNAEESKASVKRDKRTLRANIDSFKEPTDRSVCISLANDAVSVDSSYFNDLLSKFTRKIPFLTCCVLFGEEETAVIALTRMEEIISTQVKTDFQALLPIALYALSLASQKIRSKALSLISKVPRSDESSISDVYGLNDPEFENSKWLSFSEIQVFCVDYILSRSSELKLDNSYVFSYIGEKLYAEKKSKDLSVKMAITSFLTSHAYSSQFTEIRVFLLEVLHHVHGKVDEIKQQLLSPKLINLSKSESVEEAKRVTTEEAEAIVKVFDQHYFASLLALLKTDSALSQAACKQLVKLQEKLKDSQHLEFVRTLIDTEDQPLYFVNTLDGLNIPPYVFRNLLENIQINRKNGTGSKRARSSEGISAFELQKVTRVLEILETKGAANHPYLIAPLFDILNQVINLKDQIFSANYLLQLLLGLLYDMVCAVPVKELSPSIRIDTLVGCIRSTNNPQIQNKALLLVSGLSHAAPEVVLHGVMPIFTFMGTTVLSRDDAFSIHVIEQTIKTVISALVKLSSDFDSSLLISCFVNAFPHIPQHRRLRLYRMLLQTIGTDKFMSVILIQFAEKAIAAKPAQAKVIQDFCLTLSQSNSPIDRIRTINQCSLTCLESFKAQTSTQGNGKPTASVKLDQLPMELDVSTISTLRFKILELMSVVCKVRNFESDLARIIESDIEHFKLIESDLLKSLEILLELGDVLKSDEEVEHVYATLRNLIALLPDRSFCTVLARLLHDERTLLRRKALGVLQQRVQRGAKVSSLTALVPDVTFNVSNGTDEETVQLAMDCLSDMAKRFKKNPELFESSIEVVSGPYGLKSKAKDVQVSSIVCITVLSNTLGARILPYLADIMGTVLSLLFGAKNDPEGDLLELACFSMTIDLFKAIPEFSASYVEPTIKAALASERAFERDSIGELLFDTIANYIPTRHLIKSILSAWSECTKLGSTAALRLLELIEMTFQNSTRTAVSTVYKSIFRFFLDSFDSRRSLFFAEDVDNVETKAVNVFLKFVMKLSDTTFRPLFLRLQSWAMEDLRETDPSGIVSRQTFFYNFLTTFLDTLKSIVTNYYAYVLDSTVDILSSKDTNSELRHLVISSLAVAFENDAEEFWIVPARFNKLVPILLEQVQYAPLLDNKILIKAITELANVAPSSENYKAINTPLLQHLRSENTNIRVLAIQIETQLYGRLAEQWLSTLPQSVPFISEIMEDDDEQVEAATTELVRIVDDCLGDNESLQDYLT
ncbi:U3 snoRNP-associated protein Utp10 [Schizosaccharomyces cryophilus OY26]|uniref:U3 small nucleolar RNA-associated protein 10 n=1 Tax=Schizosaccharomyces cryophilus (strain OY26 / ATCC MYA-4695 / CBS 11777 / NBRC 106824 / NRRL Y48691) TaxID=653667 RepID=S9XJ28_SCHCR|nr:U3 snoRNP-associated protein Utp10 [Schizosaccharomyces cryophilus OY26]EPY53636.1 U3 snoRNP-associated protein Utp10 [Schizosaccharomyces cryophilus OY26]